MAHAPLAAGVERVPARPADLPPNGLAVSQTAPDLLLALQRTAGNAAVSRLVASRANREEPDRRLARNGVDVVAGPAVGVGVRSGAQAARAGAAIVGEWLAAAATLPVVVAGAVLGAVVLYPSSVDPDETEELRRWHGRDDAPPAAPAAPAPAPPPTAQRLDPAMLAPHLPPALMRLLAPRITGAGAIVDPLGAGLTPEVVAALARRAGIRPWAPTAVRPSGRCDMPYDQQRYEAMVTSMYSQMMLTNARNYFRGRSWPTRARSRGRELRVRSAQTTNACALVVVNRVGCVVAEAVGTKPLGRPIHAEMDALPTLALNLFLAPAEERAGASLRVISTQRPCAEICYPALRTFAAANGVFYRRGQPYEVIVPRPPIDRSANVLARDWPLF